MNGILPASLLFDRGETTPSLRKAADFILAPHYIAVYYLFKQIFGVNRTVIRAATHFAGYEEIIKEAAMGFEPMKYRFCKPTP